MKRSILARLGIATAVAAALALLGASGGYASNELNANNGVMRVAVVAPNPDMVPGVQIIGKTMATEDVRWATNVDMPWTVPQMLALADNTGPCPLNSGEDAMLTSASPDTPAQASANDIGENSAYTAANALADTALEAGAATAA